MGPTAFRRRLQTPCGNTAFATAPLTVPLPGDANLDGKVDINDLTIVLAHYNQTNGMSWSTGDFNFDGRVDINDLTIVLANYNQTLGSGSVATVPDLPPSCCRGLGGMSLAEYAWRRRDQRDETDEDEWFVVSCQQPDPQ